MEYKFTPNENVTSYQLALLFDELVGGLNWNADRKPLPEYLANQFVEVPQADESAPFEAN